MNKTHSTIAPGFIPLKKDAPTEAVNRTLALLHTEAFVKALAKEVRICRTGRS